MSITFITGASSGLGSGLAPLFAAEGDTVILAARREAALQALAQEIEASGGKAVPVVLDVSDSEAVARVFAEVQAEYGPVDTLIANAGVGQPTPATDYDSRTLEWIFSVNVMGLSYCVEAVLPQMLERGAGQIVGVSSIAGYRGLPGSGGYCASKAAAISLLESLRIELRPKGIAVTTICPGFVKTPLTESNDFDMPFLLELEEACRLMHQAIRKQKTEFAFPWQLATAVKLGRYVPNGLYDRLLAGQRAAKRPA